jgi:ubiquinone/menaquinone biosynthesis C-methylase UbiE
MVDLSKLDPATTARHLGNPEGEIGVAIGNQMNKTNGALNAAVFDRLAPRAGESILEIGFGNGKLVPLLLALAADLTYTGVDISATMAAEAEKFNRSLVDAGRVRFRIASVDAIPFPADTFDRALTVNTIYFWPEPLRGLAEVRRVLRREGVLITAAITPESAAQFPVTAHGFRLYDEARLRALHREAGFRGSEIEPYEEMTTNITGEPIRRAYHLVRSHA